MRVEAEYTSLIYGTVGQRAAVASSCALLFLLLQFESLRISKPLSFAFLAALSLLACVEKLAAILNTISVERDWVVVVAAGHEEYLRGSMGRTANGAAS